MRNHIISVDKNGDGFVATYIPKSELAPLMTTMGNNIYIRSGSNNVPAPYSVIAGMFGKRPQPNVELIIADKNLEVLDNAVEDMVYPPSLDNPPEKYLRLSFSICGENDSNVIARELYLSCSSTGKGGEYNKVRFSNYNQMDSIPGIEGQLNLITRPDLRLPPRGVIRFANVTIILSPYSEEDFLMDGVTRRPCRTQRLPRLIFRKTSCVPSWPERCAKAKTLPCWNRSSLPNISEASKR